MDEENLIWLTRWLKRQYFGLSGQSRFVQAKHKVDTGLPKCFSRPVFNFSIDFELFWGNAYKAGHEMSVQERLDNAEFATKSLGVFRQLLIELQMPTTWAVVAKLISPHMRPSPEQSFRPPWSLTDWYEVPQKASRELYEAQDFVKSLTTEQSFEVVSHGFGHIEFADPSVTSVIASEDIRLSKEVLKETVTTNEAFIYSSNKINHTEVLPPMGYHIIRGDEDSWRFRHDNKLVMTPEGFWISPAMMGLKDAIKMIDLGIKNNSFIHPWTHPRDVNFKADDTNRFYRPLFEYVKKQEKAGNLEIMSFKQIWNSISSTSSF